MDWADEKAHELLIFRDGLNPPNSMEFAAALRQAFSDGEASGERKGRASGMLEAADEADEHEEDMGHGVAARIAALLRSRASQIEKGQT